MSLRLTDLAQLVVCPPLLTSSARDVISILCNHIYLSREKLLQIWVASVTFLLLLGFPTASVSIVYSPLECFPQPRTLKYG